MRVAQASIMRVRDQASACGVCVERRSSTAPLTVKAFVTAGLSSAPGLRGEIRRAGSA